MGKYSVLTNKVVKLTAVHVYISQKHCNEFYLCIFRTTLVEKVVKKSSNSNTCSQSNHRLVVSFTLIDCDNLAKSYFLVLTKHLPFQVLLGPSFKIRKSAGKKMFPNKMTPLRSPYTVKCCLFFLLK